MFECQAHAKDPLLFCTVTQHFSQVVAPQNLQQEKTEKTQIMANQSI